MFQRLASKNPNNRAALIFTLVLMVIIGQMGASSAFAFAEMTAASDSQAVEQRPRVRPLRQIENLFQHNWVAPSLAESDVISGAALSLLTYIRENVAVLDTENPEIPRYNRIRHYGGWMRVKTGECLDTRATVLIRDSSPKHPVKMREPDGCLVIKGHWNDPYSGETFKMAAAVQVDHMVPLKNAYYSGGYRWSPARRCHYFNYLGNEYHLRTVSGHENMSKGDRSPDRYMPPNEAHQCQYLKEWMKVKTIWGLSVTSEELAMIEQTLKDRGCKDSDTVISSREFEEQRFKSESPVEKCVDFGQRMERIEEAQAQMPEAS